MLVSFALKSLSNFSGEKIILRFKGIVIQSREKEIFICWQNLPGMNPLKEIWPRIMLQN